MQIVAVTLKQKIHTCLARAYEWLFNVATNSGNWHEVRSTALVGLCLSLREPRGSPWLVAAKDWLLEQQVKMGEGKASWGDELWDTSMALISLDKLGLSKKDSHFQNAFNWIRSLYNVNGRDNWQDEPWETSWCTFAILETEASQELLELANDATKWLLSLQDSDGKIVSPHYTAYFLLICHKLKFGYEDIEILNNALTKATEYLLSTISEKTLWTGEAWSNGQILWALASTKRFPFDNDELLIKVVDWFVDKQENDGNWSDAEDTASAILGLYYLLRELELLYFFSATDVETLIFNTLRRNLDTPTLLLKRKFIENHEDGTTSINFSPKVKKNAAIISAAATAASVIIALLDFTIKMKLWDFIKRIPSELWNFIAKFIQ
jgi:hypothetical protein